LARNSSVYSMSGVFASGKRHRGFSRVNGSNLFSKESARIYNDYNVRSQVYFQSTHDSSGDFFVLGGIDLRVLEGDPGALPQRHFCPCRQRRLFCQLLEAFSLSNVVLVCWCVITRVIFELAGKVRVESSVGVART
jgi:hypothetical protein